MPEKLTKSRAEDIAPLLPPGVEFTDDDAIHAFGVIGTMSCACLKVSHGNRWKAIYQLRAKKFPKLLL